MKYQKRNVKNTIPFKIAFQKIKFLGKPEKEVKYLYAENYRILIKEHEYDA